MEVSLRMSCRIEKGALHVVYIVTNRGSLPLLSYDGAPGTPLDAEWPDLKDQIYVSFSKDAVALKRINPPSLPRGNMNRVFIPPLSQTMPGTSREVRFQLREPLEEYSQYEENDPAAQTAKRAVHNIQLQIGCFWQTEAMHPVPFPANPKAFRLSQAHGPAGVLTAEATQIVEILEQTDAGVVRR